MSRLARLGAAGTGALLIALAGCGGSGSKSTTRSAGTRAAPGHHVHRGEGGPTRRLALLPAPVHPQPRSVRVPILTWHRVHLFATELTKSIPDETVEPSVFSAEIATLASHGYHSVTQLQLYNALFHGAPLPAKPVLLSVDDGYVDDVTNILPVLRAHHMVATFYIITGRFHEPGFLNQTEVRRLDEAGMDIGAHTRTHVPLNAIGTAEMKNQVLGSRDDLRRVLGHPVQWFAYPFGAFSPAVEQELHAAGFVSAVSTQGGTVESSLAPLTMPRIHVGRTETAAGLLACMSATGGACGGGGG
jgi:peptidoglycan/xylan/chitin deacetylase (PgdA/CDA1 family)